MNKSKQYNPSLPLVTEHGSTLFHRSVNTAKFKRLKILTTTVVDIIIIHQL